MVIHMYQADASAAIWFDIHLFSGVWKDTKRSSARLESAQTVCRPDLSNLEILLDTPSMKSAFHDQSYGRWGGRSPYLVELKELLLLLEHRGAKLGLDALIKVVVAKGVRPLQDAPTVDNLAGHAGCSHFLRSLVSVECGFQKRANATVPVTTSLRPAEHCSSLKFATRASDTQYIIRSADMPQMCVAILIQLMNRRWMDISNQHARLLRKCNMISMSVSVREIAEHQGTLR